MVFSSWAATSTKPIHCIAYFENGMGEHQRLEKGESKLGPAACHFCPWLSCHASWSSRFFCFPFLFFFS